MIVEYTILDTQPDTQTEKGPDIWGPFWMEGWLSQRVGGERSYTNAELSEY